MRCVSVTGKIAKSHFAVIVMAQNYFMAPFCRAFGKSLE